MITSTSFERDEAEYATISQATTNGGKTKLELTADLRYEHYAGTQTYSGSDQVEIRAEVALMDRNIIFQGDDESALDEYGANILIHAPGDNSNIGRFSNIKL